MKTRFLRSFMIALFLALVLTSCVRVEQEAPKLNGLVITDATYKLEGEDRVQTISYKIKLHNASLTSITLDSVQPVVGDAFNVMLVSPDKLTQKIGQGIRSGASLEIKGKFEIKTNGIPRDQLDKMGILVKGFQVKSRQTLLLPGVPTSTPGPTKTPKPTKVPTEKP